MLADQPPAVLADQPPAVLADQPPAVLADQPPAVLADQPPAVLADRPPAVVGAQAWYVPAVSVAQDDIARVRAAIDIVALIGERTPLRKVGTRFSGLCPFHNEKTGSFSVNAAEGLYHCFGCGASGDAITFVRETEHLDFQEAVEVLAARAGIALTIDDSMASRERVRRKELTDVMSKAGQWFHERLLTHPDAGPARSYLRSARGYDGELVRKFGIGWAPAEWDALCGALKLSPALARDTGLGFLNRRGKLTDAFRERIMFPILDARGDAIGFGGRMLSGDGPKYKNTSETPLYNKSRVLYGLSWAKVDIVARDEVIVCEGYTDVIAFHKAGVPRAVATCGTALTEQHVRVLRNYARRVVLAYDADAAGQNAAEKFYEWERAFDLEIAVVDLPSGKDPGDLGRDDPAALAEAAAHAEPFLGFRVRRSLARGDRRTPEGRARVAEAVVPIIREHPSPLVREQYFERVASDLGFSVADLHRVSSGQPSANSAARPTAERPRQVVRDGPELELVRLLSQGRIGELSKLVAPELFVDEQLGDIVGAIASTGSVQGALSELAPELGELLTRAVVEEASADPEAVLALVVERAAGRERGRLARELATTSTPEEYLSAHSWLKQAEVALRDPERRHEAISALVPWLVDRSDGDEIVNSRDEDL